MPTTWSTLAQKGDTGTQGATGATGATGSSGAAGADGLAMPGGRLSLHGSDPVPITDQAAVTDIHYVPYVSGFIPLYSGSGDVWTLTPFSAVTLSLSGLTTSQCYDVFIYNNAGTITLEAVAWTNTTTRATSLATQNGIYVKSGAATRRYLGTFLPTATGQCDDTMAARFVYNYYNKVPRRLALTTSGTWSLAGATTWRQANATATNRVRIVAGVPDVTADLSLNASCTFNTASALAEMAFGINSTSTPSGVYNAVGGGSAGAHQQTFAAQLKDAPAIGLTAYNWLEQNQSASTNCAVGNANIVMGITGVIHI